MGYYNDEIFFQPKSMDDGSKERKKRSFNRLAGYSEFITSLFTQLTRIVGAVGSCASPYNCPGKNDLDVPELQPPIGSSVVYKYP